MRGLKMQIALLCAALACPWAGAAAGAAPEAPSGTVPILFALCLLALAAAIQLRLRLRLRRLARQAREMTALAGAPIAGAADHPPQLLSARLTQLNAALANVRNELEQQAQQRERLEEQVHESEERYALAVHGADDGMWEWNLKTGAVHYSARWKSMLGYADAEIGSGIGEWRERIHPDDREYTLRAIDAHLAGESGRFENEHRLRHRDGGFRWMLARAQAVRSAGGGPYRLVGLNTDISARRQVQEVLLEIADGLAGLSGEECYQALVETLARVVGGNEVFLTECCNAPATRVRMLACWIQGHFGECEEFDLAGTPCEEVIHSGRPLFVPGNAGSRWPQEKLDYGTEGYLGLPCIDTRGNVIGHIACKSRVEMRAELPHQAILKLFAVRAAVEIERHWLERQRGQPRFGPATM